MWCKSFLSIYRIIPNLADCVDRLVEIKASSFNHFDTMTEMENMIDLQQKKVNLINLKVLTDEVILEMNQKKSKALIFRFIDGIDNKKAAMLLKMSRRTYYRLLECALKEFQSRLLSKILLNKNVYDSLQKDNFFERIFEKIEKVEEEDNYKYDNIVARILIRELKKTY